MAVQVGSPSKPVTVNVAGVASEAVAEVGDTLYNTLPLAQDRLTITNAMLLGTKSFPTLN